MRADDDSIRTIGASNHTWLKEYMAPISERAELEKALADARAEIREMESENRRLKQVVTDLFRQKLPRLTQNRNSMK